MKLLIACVLALVACLPGGRASASGTQLPEGAAPVRYDLTLAPDAQKLTFDGQVRIALRLRRAMDSVTMNAVDLAIAHAELDGASAIVTLDAGAQTVSFAGRGALGPGRHLLSVTYSGKIGQAPAGLFVVDYQGAGGAPKRMLATQFEPSDARRVLPCFDEPAYKAVFALTAVVPAGQLALSNMPEATRARLAGGLARVRFRQTPPMSSYLLFFGAGDLERTARRIDGIEVGVVTPRGEAARARYALDAAAAVLPFYDSYFGVRYPLPKLDLVAAPGEVGGAMENWGAILFSQRYISVDPQLTTPSERHDVFDTVAHEMAHQWFGDLVTMQWWDDLWLNEGFATWMAAKATARFHPEWRPELMTLADKDAAMTQDARPGAHAIVQPVETVAQAEQAFDDITYLKGAAVIGMLEDDLGPDVFRAGVRRYIARHRFANARTEALWTALDRAARRPISAIAHDFTTQAGVPLVRVSQAATSAGLSRLDLTQDRFEEGGTGRTVGRWRIPLRSRAVGARGHAETLLLIDRAAVPGGDADPVLINAGQAGYYRTSYAPALTVALTRRVAELSPADQIGLMHDEAALGRTGDAPLSAVLELIAALPADADPSVLRQAVDVLLAIGDVYPDDSPALPAYKAWARGVLAPWWAQVGFDPRPEDPAATALLRERLITGLSRLGDAAVVVEAGRRFDAFRSDAGSLPAPIRRAVLQAMARHADAARFNQLHALARAAPGALEKEQLYAALAVVEDERLAARVLDLAIGPEPPAHSGPGLIRLVASQQPDLAWKFALADEAAIQAQLDSLQRTTFVPEIADESSDPTRAAALEAYAAAKLPPDARKAAERAATSIRWRAEVRAERLPEVIAWIAKRPRPWADRSTPLNER